MVAIVRSGLTALEVSIDATFDRRLRYALYYLRLYDEPIPLEAVALQVAAWEQGTTADAVESELYRRVYGTLYTVYLPRLSLMGVVDFDPQSRMVRLAGRHRWFRLFLRAAARVEALPAGGDRGRSAG